MDVPATLKFSEKYLADYATFFLRILAHPTRASASLGSESADDTGSSLGRLSSTHASFSRPRALAFAIISIVLGLILNSFVPSRKYSGDLAGKVVVISLCWLCFASFAYRLCRLVRGKGGFSHSAWTSLQVFSVLFVVSSAVNLFGGVIVRIPRVSSFLVSLGKLGDSVANNPVYIYFIVQFALLNVYLPLSLKPVHGLGWMRCLLVGVVLSFFWAVFGIAFYSDIGIMYRYWGW